MNISRFKIAQPIGFIIANHSWSIIWHSFISHCHSLQSQRESRDLGDIHVVLSAGSLGANLCNHYGWAHASMETLWILCWIAFSAQFYWRWCAMLPYKSLCVSKDRTPFIQFTVLKHKLTLLHVYALCLVLLYICVRYIFIYLIFLLSSDIREIVTSI